MIEVFPVTEVVLVSVTSKQNCRPVVPVPHPVVAFVPYRRLAARKALSIAVLPVVEIVIEVMFPLLRLPELAPDPMQSEFGELGVVTVTLTTVPAVLPEARVIVAPLTV